MSTAARARRRVLQMTGITLRHSVAYVARTGPLRSFTRDRRDGSVQPSATGARARAVQLRLTLEALGAASTKLGQILSTRPDVLPPDYAAELSKLQDAAAPEPAATIRAVIASELGRPVQDAFAEFDSLPLAAASIGQAHAAVLHDGTEVVVKVRRPGIVSQVELDLDIFERGVAMISRWSRAARRYDLSGLAQEFADTLRSELDYEHEAANAERFAADFAGNPDVRIPRVYRTHTTSRVITLERLRGLKLDDVAGLDAAGIDRVRLAQRATSATLAMVFEHGFFHADPHPGNFFVEPDGRIGVIDFGMVGTMDPVTRSALVRVLAALAGKDTDLLADAVTQLGMTSTELDRAALLVDLDALVTAHMDRPLAELRIGPLLNDVLAVLRRHRLHLPRNLALLAKTFAMCEGVAAQLDPSFRMTAAIFPYLDRPGVIPDAT